MLSIKLLNNKKDSNADFLKNDIKNYNVTV